MGELTFSNGALKVCVAQADSVPAQYYVARVMWMSAHGWVTLVTGAAGSEFVTSLGSVNAESLVAEGDESRSWVLNLRGTGDGWEAQERIELAPQLGILQRTHTYTFHHEAQASVAPGWRLPYADDLRYTYALRAHEQLIREVPALRSDVAWALPLPFHVWHNDHWVALYGIDRRISAGTLDFMPLPEEDAARLSVYFPDRTPQPDGFGELPRIPDTHHFMPGDTLTLSDVLIVKPLQDKQEPLLEAERVASDFLLSDVPSRNLSAVADGIADYLDHCELWNADAFGTGRGWFRNMWVYTQSGTPKKQGSASGYYDMGWGEGIAAEIVLAAVRNCKRSGQLHLLPYVNEMTRNMHLFRRGEGDDQPYFDRSDGKAFGDFMMGRRIWTHSLGHTGSQLLQAYIESTGYPHDAVRDEWLHVAASIANFFAAQQAANGDLLDIFDDENHEVNTKPHRIAARAVVCGLWCRMADVTGDRSWINRALRLANAAAPDIEAYAYYNQMIDGLGSLDIEFMDGEAAYYVLEGLAPLYAATHDVTVLALCRKAVAFGVAWTYFYDLPQGNNGVTRGGQCCRMPDYPLLYPIGPAKAVEPLLMLHESTGDSFYTKMANEMVQFIAAYQWDCPGKPWHGGIIHAIDQSSGKHWGPDKCGQVDSGMASANSLAALEKWLAHSTSATEPTQTE